MGSALLGWVYAALDLLAFLGSLGILGHKVSKEDRIVVSQLIAVCESWLQTESAFQLAQSAQKYRDCADNLGIAFFRARLESHFSR